MYSCTHTCACTHTHTQAANLIQANKQLPEEAQAIFSTCSKLNSRQIGTLLHYCSIAEGEPVNQAFVEGLILLAKSHASELTQGDGTELNLEEDPNLELPFLIPQQGYSCDTFRGIPPGLQDFLEPMISGGELYIHNHLIADLDLLNPC